MREQESQLMTTLTKDVRTLLLAGQFETARQEIAASMALAPDAAQPHNLMGILLERMHRHADAMKHFRVAWALDPTFEPAKQNLERFGEMQFPLPAPIFDEADCQRKAARKMGHCHIEYDQKGIGRVVRG